MDKASMLYNKYKTMFLVGEGETLISQVINKSLAEQRQYEDAKKGALKRAENSKEPGAGEETLITSPPTHIPTVPSLLQSNIRVHKYPLITNHTDPAPRKRTNQQLDRE